MSRNWLTADLHLGQRSICHFKRDDGSPLRPWDNLEDMHEALIERFNAVVKPEDRVYMVGDIVIKHAFMPLLDRLNGRKVLVKGNHDIDKLNVYSRYFDDIRAIHKLADIYVSHVPIHRSCIPPWCMANVHGHLHQRRIMINGKIDPKYYCVSVEQTNYAPILFEQVLENIREQQKEYTNEELATSGHHVVQSHEVLSAL